MFNNDQGVKADVEYATPAVELPYQEAVQIAKHINQCTTELVAAMQERDQLYRKLNELDEYIRDHRQILRQCGDQMERIMF